MTETVLHFRSLIFNLVWKINSECTEIRRLGFKTQMMAASESKSTGLGDYLVVESKGEEGVKDDHQVSVPGD